MRTKSPRSPDTIYLIACWFVMESDMINTNTHVVVAGSIFWIPPEWRGTNPSGGNGFLGGCLFSFTTSGKTVLPLVQGMKYVTADRSKKLNKKLCLLMLFTSFNVKLKKMPKFQCASMPSCLQTYIKIFIMVLSHAVQTLNFQLASFFFLSFISVQKNWL